MKTVKRFFAIFLVLLLVFTISNNKQTNINAVEIKDEREFKAVWMSTFVGEAPYNNEVQFKSHMMGALDILENYGLNALIFHVRTHNNAFYKSELNPVASWWSRADFDVFDPLGWLIDETHKRGIEFHAWMNPYRVDRNRQVGEVPLENPQSDPNNLIYGSTTILNPSLPHVKEHIYNTIDEFATLYPTVDAVHFDDYFYVNTNEHPTSANARRAHVTEMIEGVKETLMIFNERNNTNIQLGISPTGVWRNGTTNVVEYDEDGNPITDGSMTNGYSHYGDPLYADTVKWAIDGSIDYLIPQTYWARNRVGVNYGPLMTWWNDVFKNLTVNIYSGLGVYMADGATGAGWSYDMTELAGQFSILDDLDSVDGYSIYSYKHLRNGYTNSSNQSGQQIRNGFSEESRSKVRVLPEIKNMEPKTVLGVNNMQIFNNLLTWESVDDAKFYYIYQSRDELTYSSDEIVDVIGHKEGLMSFDTTKHGKGNFGVRPISKTNHLGPEPIPIKYHTVTFNYGYDSITTESKVKKGETSLRPEAPIREGYIFKGWYFNYEEFDFNMPINTNLTVLARWEEITPPLEYVTVTFDEGNNNIFNKEVVKGLTVLKPLTPYKEEKLFLGWYLENNEYDFNSLVTTNLTLKARWEDLDRLENVSIYSKTEIREANKDVSMGLRYYGIINPDFINNEHGFYLVYGTTTKSTLLNAIESEMIINDRVVFKVVIDKVTNEGVYSVVLTGIPEKGYDDVITVVPYALDNNGNLVLSKEFQSSTINHALEVSEILINNYVALINKRRKFF